MFRSDKAAWLGCRASVACTAAFFRTTPEKGDAKERVDQTLHSSSLATTPEQGPSTQYSKSLVPNTMKGMEPETSNVEYLDCRDLTAPSRRLPSSERADVPLSRFQLCRHCLADQPTFNQRLCQGADRVVRSGRSAALCRRGRCRLGKRGLQREDRGLCYVCMHIHIHIHLDPYVHVLLHLHKDICIYTCTYIYIYMRV